jgi:tetratricopeptide (TPR) repeat protein
MYAFLQEFNPAASQDFSVGGRIAWAIYCCNAGEAAMEKGNLTSAITTLTEAIHAFPFPASLGLLGECLFLEGKFVEATIYLAAAVGMSEQHEFRLLFLLGKALAAANDDYVSKIMLNKAILIKPDQAAQELLSKIINRSGSADQSERASGV